MQDQTVPQTTSTDDEVKPWYFTFGAGQRFDGRYVKFTGTYDTARAAMLARFGNAWCAQYDSLSPTRGFPLGVEELPASEWPQPAEPDYWLTLADDLRQAAERIATLAGTPAPAWTHLAIVGAAPQNATEASAKVIDAVADAFGTKAYTSDGGDKRRHGADVRLGAAKIQAYTYMPPEQSELERLRARNAELEAQLAEGGAR